MLFSTSYLNNLLVIICTLIGKIILLQILMEKGIKRKQELTWKYFELILTHYRYRWQRLMLSIWLLLLSL